MAATLAASRIAASENTTRALVMLHGIYGRGRNWLGIARAISAARPEYACWLVDLPYHGDSPASRHGDTVHGLAADVNDWLAAHAIVPDAILGHSFGGKVALAMAAAVPERGLQVWIIDSTPEVKAASGSAWDMLAVIRRMPSRFDTREQLVDGLVAAGYAVGVAQWMATNLIRSPGRADGFVWRLDFGAMERLLTDFFRTDLWTVIETPAPGREVHVLKASESSAISPTAVARLEAASAGRVHVHHRPGGHWIHAEAPDVVTALLVEHLR